MQAAYQDWHDYRADRTREMRRQIRESERKLMVRAGQILFAAHREQINSMTHAEYQEFKANRVARFAQEC